MNDKMFHIPYEQVIVPIDRSTVMMNKWWTVFKEGHISIYTGGKKPNEYGFYRIYSPQCNSSEYIAKRLGKTDAVFLPIVYFEDKLILDLN